MSQAEIAKAILIPMNGDQPETDPAKQIVVQFNPTTLKVTLANTLKADSKPGGKGNSPAAQFIEKSESSLSVELLFDSSVTMSHKASPQSNQPSGQFSVAALSDVRELTGKVAAAFMQPIAPAKGSKDKPSAPKRCRFQWGTFQFTGMVSSYNETLDYFSPQGVPLRATLSLTLKEDKYQFDRAQLPAGSQSEPPSPTFASGGEKLSALRAAQNAGRDPKDWRQIALFNGLDNPRFGFSVGLSLPEVDLELDATSSISALALAPKVSIENAGLDLSVQASFDL